MIRKRVLRTGDGTHRYANEKADAKTARELLDTFNNNANGNNDEHVDTLWGWGKRSSCLINVRTILSSYFAGDDDMDADEKKDVKILHPKFGD
jgi:hypothetical protein